MNDKGLPFSCLLTHGESVSGSPLSLGKPEEAEHSGEKRAWNPEPGSPRAP